MYIPIAFYKNNLVLIDSMDSFALYFCSSVKQKMTPEPGEAAGFGGGVSSGEVGDDEFSGSAFAPEDSYSDAFEDEDDL
ncbi:MAG TPA: hypothetical protein VK436_03445 [Methanocella sp.]|nr:hypothetical protein [Methanocella sp.]